MRLARVEIKNFRSVADVTIPFEPSCRVLVGVNESGKSNILKAMALLDAQRQPKSEDLREYGPDEPPDQSALVRFVFRLEPNEKAQLLEKLSAKVYEEGGPHPIIKMDGRELTFQEFCESKHEVLYQADIRSKEKVFNYWALTGKPQICGGWFKLKASPAGAPVLALGGKPASSYSLVYAKNLQVATEGLQPFSPDDLNKLVGSELIAIAKANLPKVVFWSYADSNLLPGQIPTASFVNDPSSCMPLKQMFALAGFENPAKAIQDAKVRPNGMRNLLERVGEAATRHLVSVWKDYRGVRIKLIQNGEHIDATIEDTFNHYDMARRSDGFKRFVTFILLVSAQAKTKSMENTLYLHDEPDISLHPSGARYLRDELIKISLKNYVVYSTHSIFMIDREAIGRHLIVKKKKEVTTVETVSDSNIVDEEVIYNALGHSVFECLRPMNIVFEGWRDKKLFNASVSQLQKSDRAGAEFLAQVGCCHAKGVKDIGRITPMIELAARQCIILSDGDTVAKEHQRGYDGYGEWIRYDELLPDEVAVTSEDFLRPEAFAQPVADARIERPELIEFNASELNNDEPKLRVLERWLQKSGVQGEVKKEILNQIKEALIENLKPAHIEDKYFELLKALAAKVKAQMS